MVWAGICRESFTQKGKRKKRKLENDRRKHWTVILKKFGAYESGTWSKICHTLMFLCFYHARQKIALISGAKRMEIRTMATLGSLVIHHCVIFPSLLLIQNTLGVGEGGGGGGLANSVETNVLVTIFVQRSITTFTSPMEDKG